MRALREWWRGVRRWAFMRRNPGVGAAEMLVQKSGALNSAEFRRDPCAPGGCRLLEATKCTHCKRRLYECESVRIGNAARGKNYDLCASCQPFDASYKGAPDGWLANDVCSHGKPLWQTCQQCEADNAVAPESLGIER